MALCGVGVGAEKNQFCAVIAQDNRVTGQVNVNQPGKGDDVFTEHIRLRFTGRQKNLVMTGFQGAQQRLAGKIKRRANLAGFQDIADAVLKPGAIPVQLIFERLLKENLLQLFDGLVTEKILFRFATPAFVAVKRGEQVIEQVTLMKPNAGTLRGVSLAAVANSEVDALIKVLPRMTAPMLTEQEVAALELPDLVALAGKVVGFLSPNSVQ